MWPRLTAGGGNNDAAGGLEVGYGRATLNMADGTDGALDEVEEEAGDRLGTSASGRISIPRGSRTGGGKRRR
jgi:hypothetical protein